MFFFLTRKTMPVLEKGQRTVRMTSEYLFEFVKEKERYAVAAQADGQGRSWTSSGLPARSL
jgi:hypothetical protein